MRLKEQKIRNIQKTWLIMGVFLVVVIGLGWLVGGYLGSPGMLYFAAGFAILMNMGAFFFSDKIALKMSGAKEVSYEEQPELYTAVKNLSQQAKLPMPRVYIINDPAPNAFATGRSPSKSAVAVTTGLMNMLDQNELQGVLAHELSHINNRDILVMTIAVVLVGFLSMASDMFWRVSLFGGGGDNDRGGALAMAVGIGVMILAPLAGTLMQLAISRKREFLADASGALMTHNPEGLASALQKISGYNAPMRRASHATAHLFISNPFGPAPSGAGQALKKRISKYFSTHPPVEERVAALRGRHM